MARTKITNRKGLVLRAALERSGGDPRETFSFEELLVQAWHETPDSWGLRGFEREHPDPERLHRELSPRGKGQPGLVGEGLMEKVGGKVERLYRITPKGLAVASELAPVSSTAREQADRTIEAEVLRIIEHPVFLQWLKDHSKPRRFREAGHFWGIAPGTPPKTAQERIRNVEETISAALDLLRGKEDNRSQDGPGRLRYGREDLERSLEFQETLKERFEADLKFLLNK